MSTPSIVIASVARTAAGSLELSPTRPRINAVPERTGVEASEMDEVIRGEALPRGEGKSPARQAMKAWILREATACRVHHLRGLGLRAAAVGLQQIVTGDAKIIVADGQELMSMTPRYAHLRNGTSKGGMK